MTQEIPGLPANWPELTGQALANLPFDEFEVVWQAIGKSVRAAAKAKVAARSETAAASAPLAETWAQENISPNAARRHDVAVEAFQAGYAAGCCHGCGHSTDRNPSEGHYSPGFRWSA